MNIDIANFNKLWSDVYAKFEPRAESLKLEFKPSWLRLYTLANAKRYAENTEEQTAIINRYNDILNDINPSGSLFVLTCAWSDSPAPPTRLNKYEKLSEEYWKTLNDNPGEPTPDFASYRHIYVSRVDWHKGCLNDLLAAVSNDEEAGVIIMPPTMNWLYHPYDGGVDVIVRSERIRKALEQKFKMD